MAHFAKLDENNIVTEIIVVANPELLDNGIESESKGIAFCQDLLGGNWKQTSYNRRIRKNYAGIGFKYDESRDAFIPPQPFPSWLSSEETCLWSSPVPYPSDDKQYSWDEATVSWIQINV